MMSNIKVYLSALLLLLGASAKAQTPVLPLDTVLNRISQNNGMLKEIEFRAKAQNAMAKGPEARWHPWWAPGSLCTRTRAR
ncbi:hypothetical protein [Rufibacter sp. LB8]|uniref:hypothetical protein n=1 Tax=Rufibacter sp. LB8 TaxID=2777781 RepID=UPI00178C81A3|nr:hypothetical protein [Rufibacter sp. LB8]